MSETPTPTPVITTAPSPVDEAQQQAKIRKEAEERALLARRETLTTEEERRRFENILRTRNIENTDNIEYQAKARAMAERFLMVKGAGPEEEVIAGSYTEAYTKDKSAMASFRDMPKAERMEYLCDFREKQKGKPTDTQLKEREINADVLLAYYYSEGMDAGDIFEGIETAEYAKTSKEVDAAIDRKYPRKASAPEPKKETPPAAVASSPAAAPFTLSSFLKDIGGFWGAVGVAALALFGFSKSDNGRTNFQNIVASFNKPSDPTKRG